MAELNQININKLTLGSSGKDLFGIEDPEDEKLPDFVLIATQVFDNEYVKDGEEPNIEGNELKRKFMEVFRHHGISTGVY